MTSGCDSQGVSLDPSADIAASDGDGFAAFVRPHWPTMAIVAGRIAGADDRDDALQEALVRAWRHRASFDPRRGSARTWLLAITANAARRTAEQQRARPVPDPGLAATSGTTEGHPGDVGQPDVEGAIAGLPERQRLAVTLYYFAELSVRETAQVMECAEGTVKATLSAARQSLRQSLKDHADE